MPKQRINNLTSVKNFSEDFYKYAVKMPESISEDYAKMGIALLAITKSGITDEMFADYCETLQGLQELLTRKVDEGKRVIDIIMENKTPEEEAETVIGFGNIINATGINASIADIFYPDAKVEIDGVSYTKKEFRQKMYENHWREGEDDKIIDAVYDGYIGASRMLQIKDRTKKMKRVDEAIREMINVPVVAGREKASKKNSIQKILSSAIGDPAYNGNWRFLMNYKNGITDDMVAKESNENDRADFIRRMKAGAYNRPGDEDLLTALFDGRFDKDGNFDVNYQKYVIERFRPDDSAEKRESNLKYVKNHIEKRIPEDARTEHHKKAIAEINRQLNEVIPAMKQEEAALEEQRKIEAARRAEIEKAERELDEKAQAFQKSVHENNFYTYSNLYADMYKVGAKMPEDHPFNKLLDNLRKGITEKTPFKNIKEDNSYSGYQTLEELNEAQRILKEVENKTPEINKIITSIDDFRKEYANKAGHQKEDYDKEVAFENGPIVTNKDVLLEVENAIRDQREENRAALPENYKEIEEAFKTLAHPKKIFGSYTYDSMEKAEKYIADNAVGFFGSLTTDSPVYQKGIVALEKLWPDAVQQTKALATAKTDEVKRLNDEAVLAGKVSKLDAVKNTLEGIKKAYFNHDNSTQYERFVRAVTASANAKTLDEYNSLKKELVESATKYLDHTGLDRASKYHDKAEMRRLCAFQVISMAGDEAVAVDYLTRANKLRNAENKVSKERLDKLVINGGKEKTSAEELLKEDRDTFRKESAKNKTKAVSHKEKENNTTLLQQ